MVAFTNHVNAFCDCVLEEKHHRSFSKCKRCHEVTNGLCNCSP